jgi:hypothetical protein
VLGLGHDAEPEVPIVLSQKDDVPDTLPGYLCEACLDAPAVQVQAAPWGGEMGVCAARIRLLEGTAHCHAHPLATHPQAAPAATPYR